MYILEVSVGKMSYWVIPGDPSDWGLKHVMLVDTQEWDGDRVGLRDLMILQRHLWTGDSVPRSTRWSP